jgi:hypothetical protein
MEGRNANELEKDTNIVCLKPCGQTRTIGTMGITEYVIHY